MHNIEYGQRDFIGYEYKEIIADSDKASFFVDSYENFGWIQDDNQIGTGINITIPLQYPNKVMLHLKRNRKIVNKVELTRLQRNFEACVKEIEELERTKTSMATAYALAMGVIGIVFIAGSFLSITASVPHIFRGVLLAIPGILGCIFPFFVYRRVEESQVAKTALMIEEKYNEIYKICEKGNKLLY